MPEIDFTAIRPLADGRREGFEELSCQIFRQAPEAEAGWRFQRNRGAGGDGGVEALWTAPDGRKWGLQSKYFNTLETSQKSQMKKSLDTALRNHPELWRYTFTLPCQLSGSAAAGTSRPRKGSKENLSGWIEEWKAELAAKGVDLEIDFWEGTELSGRLQKMDPSGGRQRYWFDKTILSDAWFERHLDDARAQAGSRYTPELSIHVPLLDTLEAFAESKKFKAEVRSFAEALGEQSQDWSSMQTEESSADAWGGPPVPEPLWPQVAKAGEALTSLASQFRRVATDPEFVIPDEFWTTLDGLIEGLKACEAGFKEQLEADHGKGADSPGFRQYSAEYRVSFPAANLDRTRETLNSLNDLHSGRLGQSLRAKGTRELLIHGPAGVGKTHAIVDNSIDRSRRQLRSILIYGEDFNDEDPWRTIVAKLGLDAGIGRDELLAILDSAAEASGEKLILCIDAVNETEPDRRRWRAWYPVISRQISRSHGLKLLVSCRDTYLGECLPEWADLPKIEHNGFLGREFEVVPRFFEHYGLTLPSSPLLQSEFGNPLFLHIVCQSLAEHGLTTIPEGGGGFSSVVNELLKAKNRIVAGNLGYHAGEPHVQTAINGLARKMNEQGSQRLSVEVARDTVSEGCQPPELAGKLFEALEKESLISIAPEGPPAFGQTQRGLYT